MMMAALILTAVATAPDRYIVEVPEGFAPPVVRMLPDARMVPGDRARAIKCDGMSNVRMGSDGKMQLDCGGEIRCVKMTDRILTRQIALPPEQWMEIARLLHDAARDATGGENQ